MIINGVPVTFVDIGVFAVLIGGIMGLLVRISINHMNTHLPGPPGHAEWVDSDEDIV